MLGQLVEHALPLAVVDGEHGVDHVRGRTEPAALVGERLEVLAEARTTEPDAGPQEQRADPRVEADRSGHRGDVGTRRVAEVGDLVDERDLGREEGVAGELQRLGGGDVGAHEAIGGQQRRVQLGHQVTGPGRVIADHDLVGVPEVGQAGALAEELGVRHVQDAVEPPGVETAPALDAGARWHGRLHHDGLPGGQRDAIDDGPHRAQVGLAGGAGGGADGHEEQLAGLQRGLVARGEVEQVPVLAQAVLEAGFEERDLASLQHGQTIRVRLDAVHLVAELGQADRADEPDVAGADDREHLPLGVGHPPVDP